MKKIEFVNCIYFTILALLFLDNICEIAGKIYAKKVYKVPIDYTFMMEKMFIVYTISLIFMISVFFITINKYIEKGDK